MSNFIRVLAYNVTNDPLYVKLEKAADAAKKGRFPQAASFMKMIEKNMKDKVKNYGMKPVLKDELPDLQDKFQKTLDLVEAGDPRSVPNFETMIDTLKELGPEINKHQLPVLRTP